MPRLEQLKALIAEPRTLVMGVLNVTPDSFSDGGEYLDPDLALRYAAAMIGEGAGVIDIGGQSTRPPGKTYGEGAKEISVEEERERVIPILRTLAAAHPDALYSVDTTRSVIAREAIEAGADIINDVSAGTSDTEMFSVCADFHAPIILMHGHGPEFAKSSIEQYSYEHATAEVLSWLARRIDVARKAGVPYIIADCGFGFAKTTDDSIRLLREHDNFLALGVPMALGVSRKSAIGTMLGGNVRPKERVFGSIGAAIFGALHGAKMIRTHDVRATRDALKVVDAIRYSR